MKSVVLNLMQDQTEVLQIQAGCELKRACFSKRNI